jgi:hypothetical protein
LDALSIDLILGIIVYDSQHRVVNLISALPL